VEGKSEGCLKGLLRPELVKAPTPRKNMLTRNKGYVKLITLRFEQSQVVLATVGSRHTFSEIKQRAEAVKVTGNRHQMIQRTVENSGNEQVVDPVIAGCVPFLGTARKG
jgi:lipid II:glycine glycyltransferase (peptidoglycan interpeptide bridge formation enzyme)